jgi:DUF3047 family protein
LKKILQFAPIFLLACHAHGFQVAMIALDAASWVRGRIPTDWQIKVKDGKPDISTCAETDTPCIHLKSVKASFAVERKIRVNPAELSYLSWSWKVTQIPARGDFRRASTDDQAAQMLVAFDDNRVISYIWDTTAPKGTLQSASAIPLVHIFALVCQSGAGEMNRWIRENHNVAADYERAYKRPAPHVKGLRIQINSQHTGSTAESYFGDVAFLSAPRE